MNIFIRQMRPRDRERTIYTKKINMHNNKITEMHTNIKHRPDNNISYTISGVARGERDGPILATIRRGQRKMG